MSGDLPIASHLSVPALNRFVPFARRKKNSNVKPIFVRIS